MGDNKEKTLEDFLPSPKQGTFSAGTTLETDAELAKEDEIISALKTVYDPEIPVDIYELGLIYRIEQIDTGQCRGDINIDMTLTNPACPVAGILPQNVANAVAKVEGVGRAVVELVWSPPWTKESMSKKAKILLTDIF